MDIKSLLWGAVGGIVAGFVATTTLFGYVSSGTADEAVRKAVTAEKKVTTAVYAKWLTPQCVDNATAADQADALAAVLAKSPYNQAGEVKKAGWTVYPEGADSSLKSALDKACATELASAN